MLPKHNIVIQMDHVHDVVGVVLLEELQDLQCYSRLIVILFLVLDHFECHFLPSLVIRAQDTSAERSLSKEFLDLIAEPDMIVRHDLIVALLVIISKVMLEVLVGLDFLRGRCS